MMLQLIPGQHIHFVGIGGFGLSAIARLLLEQGFQISGSDMARNSRIDALVKDGATIYYGHDAAYVGEAELVVMSSAIPDTNIEILTALAENVPVYKRADILETIMKGHLNIAVAGTHGKTTTSAMIAHVLTEADQSPTYLVGGILMNTGTNAKLGNGDAFIIEADEYDNMFHGLRPDIEVITNVEYDHPDFFQSPREMVQSFSHFIGILPEDGLLVACVDDPIASIFARNRIIVHLPTVTYGINNSNADWRAVNIKSNGRAITFDVIQNDETLGSVSLQVPGRHNVLNALATLIVAEEQGVPFDQASQALSNFKGTSRRFEIRGEVDDIIVIDDYAHHPTAIKATIHATRERFPEHKIWAIWQPHTYTRTKMLGTAYLHAFDSADVVLVTDIYASREKPIPGVNSKILVDAMTHPRARYTPSFDDVLRFLHSAIQAPAVVLIMSAGDAPEIGEQFLSDLQGDDA